MTKQPLLPPLLPVVQQGRVSAGHSRSSSRSQVELKAGSASTPNLIASASAAALEEANNGSASGVRQPRPRSMAVLTGPSPDLAYDSHRWVLLGAGSDCAALAALWFGP